MASRKRSLPGSFFLRVARLVFPDDTVTRVFVPAVADFHDELREAGAKVLARGRVRCRWYVALASLAVVSPLPMPSPGALLALVTLILYIGAWQFFGWFMAGTATAGVALAVALRTWNTRHPSVLRDPSQADPAAPEINLSAIHVGGDIAGLMFAVGSVIVVFLGIPQLWWYYAGAMVVSAAVAWLRFTLLRFSRVTNTSILRT